MMNPRRGISLIEVAVSTLIVGVLAVAAVGTVGGAQLSRKQNAERTRGGHLALDLMAEVQERPYQDPTDDGLLGLDLDEILNLDRRALDDIDDYHNLTDSPPRHADGALISGYDSDWTRAVTVRFAEPNNPDTDSATDKGVKRITVTVSLKNKTVATLTLLRSKAWEAGSVP